MSDDTSSIRLPRVDWADYLPGDDEALHVRHILSHEVFGEELWADERVRAFFAPWFDRFDGVLRAARADMDDDALTGLFAPLYRDMANPLVDLCADVLGVAPWVSIDLLRRFVSESSSRIDGKEAWLRAEIEHVPLAAAADYEATFRIRKGMTAEEAQRALAEFNARVILETGMLDDDSGRPRRTPLPKNKGRELIRDTRWYYCARIRGESLAEIARRHCTAYQNVQQAIKRVAPLVEIFVMPPPVPTSQVTRSKRGATRKPKARHHKVRRRTKRR